MIILILSIITAIFAISASSIIILQAYNIGAGKVVVDADYNGPQLVRETLHTVIRFILKRSIYFRRFFMQYVFHIMVRVMHLIDILTSYLYAKSRNWFVKNAVRNKGTVPHFWEHLKVYKQEMDQERRDEEI